MGLSSGARHHGLTWYGPQRPKRSIRVQLPSRPPMRDIVRLMRIALIGDIHYYRLFTAPWNLIGKRALGSTNLWLSRRHHFIPEALPPVVERVVSLSPDLVLFSGDLTTTALRPEFRDVKETIAPILDRFPTVIIPGNHDRYTFASARKRRIEEHFPDHSPHEYPHGDSLTDAWRLLALDASIPQWIRSRGRCGQAQLERARLLLRDDPAEQNVLTMCHYPAMLPPDVHGSSNHRLENAAQVRNLLEAAAPKRVLYVHGHIHRPWIFHPETESLKHVTFLNAGAPCHVSDWYPFGQGFWELHVPDRVDEPLSVAHHRPTTKDAWEIDEREDLATISND